QVPLMISVSSDQRISMATITVMICMTRKAFPEDSWIPLIFDRQKYAVTTNPKNMAKRLGSIWYGWCKSSKISFSSRPRYCPADTELIGPVRTKSTTRAETETFASVGPIESRTTTYTPPRTNMLQLSRYTDRTAKLKNMTARMNQGADWPIACSAIPPA